MAFFGICRGVAAKFQKSSILFEKYNFGFGSIFFGPISVQLSNFHRCFYNTDASAETGDFLKRYIWSEKHIQKYIFWKIISENGKFI